MVSEGTRTPDGLGHNHGLGLFLGENGDLRCSQVLSDALRFAQVRATRRATGLGKTTRGKR